MSAQLSRRALVIGGVALAAAGPLLAAPSRPELVEVASADRSWVHVAVSPAGRTFADFSRWFGPLSVAVIEGMPGSVPTPFRDAAFIAADAAVSAAARVMSIESICVSHDGRSPSFLASDLPQMQTTSSIG